MRWVCELGNKHRAGLRAENPSEADEQSAYYKHWQVHSSPLNRRCSAYEKNSGEENRLSTETIAEIANNWQSDEASDRLRRDDRAQKGSFGVAKVTSPLLEGLKRVHQRGCGIPSVGKGFCTRFVSCFLKY